MLFVGMQSSGPIQSLLFFAFEFVLEALIALDAQDGQAAVLAGLGQPEEDGP